MSKNKVPKHVTPICTENKYVKKRNIKLPLLTPPWLCTGVRAGAEGMWDLIVGVHVYQEVAVSPRYQLKCLTESW